MCCVLQFSICFIKIKLIFFYISVENLVIRSNMKLIQLNSICNMDDKFDFELYIYVCSWWSADLYVCVRVFSKFNFIISDWRVNLFFNHNLTWTSVSNDRPHWKLLLSTWVTEFVIATKTDLVLPKMLSLHKDLTLDLS